MADPFTAATAACRSRREKSRNVSCFSPWIWFRKRTSRGRMNLDEQGCEGADDDQIEIGCFNPESSPSNSVLEVSTGFDKRDASLSLGVGLGLLYLMATNNTEMKKLAELCKQMEALLQNFRREFPNGQANNENCIPRPQVFSNYPADQVSIQEYCPSYSGSDFTSSSYQNSHSKLRKRKGEKLEMDQLEAELEAELENLQLHLDDEVMINYSNHKNPQMMVDSECPAEEPLSTCFQGALENKRHEGGVQARELERRLLQLQEERIRELEIALENATKNIDENQRELSWWKDTARIVFQHSPNKILENTVFP